MRRWNRHEAIDRLLERLGKHLGMTKDWDEDGRVVWYGQPFSDQSANTFMLNFRAHLDRCTDAWLIRLEHGPVALLWQPAEFAWRRSRV